MEDTLMMEIPVEDKIANRMELNFLSKSSNEGLARLAAAAFVAYLNPTMEELTDIKTAVTEAVTNAIIHGYGNENDVLLAITTSGNSGNVLHAVKVAQAKNMKTIGLTGPKGGKLKEAADTCICVPGSCTADIQELHLPVYHALCAMLEERFFE